MRLKKKGLQNADYFFRAQCIKLYWPMFSEYTGVQHRNGETVRYDISSKINPVSTTIIQQTTFTGRRHMIIPH